MKFMWNSVLISHKTLIKIFVKLIHDDLFMDAP